VTLFERILDEAIKLVVANDDRAKRLFRAGDVDHLQRWRDDGRAAEIWEALHPGRLDARGMSIFIIATLHIRQMAEDLNRLNRTISGLRRRGKKLAPKERRRAVNLLTKGELSPQEFAELEASFKEAETGRDTDFLEPIFAVRSNKHGTRQRQCTIFCRLVSDLVRRGTRWHDKEVAALGEIALNRKDITTEMVRSAREAGRRDATRKSRRKA
jgi:hypothetical protein